MVFPAVSVRLMLAIARLNPTKRSLAVVVRTTITLEFATGVLPGGFVVSRELQAKQRSMVRQTKRRGRESGKNGTWTAA